MRNRFIACIVLFVVVCGLRSVVRAETVMSVYAASAPNAYGSPSYAGWVNNAIYAIENQLSSQGTLGTPTYYTQLGSTISISENIVTGFPSWKGKADPGTVFGPASQSELGNRVQFGLHITSDTTFSISQLSFVMSSDDASNSLGYTYGGYVYSDQYVGINWGPDGVKGGGDDVRITSGSNTQLVNELVGRGSGNAWAVYDTDPGATRQQKIDNAVRGLGNQPIVFTGTYTLNGMSASDSVTMTAVPVPSAALGGFALMGLLFGAKKLRQARTA